MQFFARAVVTGFALSLGSALFKKVQGHLGLGEPKDADKKQDETNKQDGATDPGVWLRDTCAGVVVIVVVPAGPAALALADIFLVFVIVGTGESLGRGLGRISRGIGRRRRRRWWCALFSTMRPIARRSRPFFWRRPNPLSRIARAA